MPYTHTAESLGAVATKSRVILFQVRTPSKRDGSADVANYVVSVEMEKFDAAGNRLASTQTFELRGAEVATFMAKMIVAETIGGAAQRLLYEQAVAKGKAPAGGTVT